MLKTFCVMVIILFQSFAQIHFCTSIGTFSGYFAKNNSNYNLILKIVHRVLYVIGSI